MTVKRAILVVLTLVAITIIGSQLFSSLTQPQFQSRLELYQTNLLLQATEWQGDPTNADFGALRKTLLGLEPLKTATSQYQDVRKSAQENLDKLQARKTDPGETRDRTEASITAAIRKQERSLAELDLRLGVLQVRQGKTNDGLETWNGLIRRSLTPDPVTKAATALKGLWSDPAQLLPDAEPQIQKQLDGWFRYQALTRLYQLQQRQDALSSLQQTEQQAAEQAFVKLGAVSILPGLGLFSGIVLLLVLSIQWVVQVVQRKRPLVPEKWESPWQVPWSGDEIAQGMVVGFFFFGQIILGQIVLPILLQTLRLNPALFDGRTQAFYVLATYLSLTVGGLLVLYWTVKPYFPLTDNWFQFNWRSNWFLWGLGGYAVAWPLVLGVSLLNQLIWKGQGGSNPILPIALEGKDRLALVIFFLTASVAAPFFEEIMFRGFLLPSLTRYLPVWGAIATSALLFAIAHQSLSEVLPLTVLGMILGFVYTRSRNLLASMLLHSLWNSGTLLSLFILGSGGN